MVATAWTDEDTTRARRFWAEYVQQHDLSSRVGQTAGIDPISGNVYFGESAADIALKLQAAGTMKPLYFVRVGSDYYVRKGAHR